MTAREVVDACHSHHVDAPCPDAERIDWRTPTRRTQHVRVRDHTCDCRNPPYELCTAAGLWFIRRSHEPVSGTARTPLVEPVNVQLKTHPTTMIRTLPALLTAGSCGPEPVRRRRPYPSALLAHHDNPRAAPVRARTRLRDAPQRRSVRPSSSVILYGLRRVLTPGDLYNSEVVAVIVKLIVTLAHGHDLDP